MTEEEIEQERQYNYELGMSAGYAGASGDLLKSALWYFERSDDTTAALLRSQSKLLNQHAKRIRPFGC